MSKKLPRIPCRACSGTGTIPVPSAHLATYKALRKSKKPLTAFDLEETGVSHSAICNRLAELEKAGLIERAGKSGKNILWRSVR